MAASALSEEGFQVLTTLGVIQDNLKGWSPKQAPSVLCYGLMLGLFSSSLCSPLLGQNEISLCWRSGVKTPELSLKYVAIRFPVERWTFFGLRLMPHVTKVGVP